MGNCCEAIDTHLEEILQLDDLDTSYNNTSHNRYHSNSTSESYQQNTLVDELQSKFTKFRYPKYKLNTIVEDNHEDLISSPFLLKRVKYV